jgi:hypothetical protein
MIKREILVATMAEYMRFMFACFDDTWLRHFLSKDKLYFVENCVFSLEIKPKDFFCHKSLCTQARRINSVYEETGI